MNRFYFFLFLILLIQNHSNAYAVDAKESDNKSNKTYFMGEEIIKRLNDFNLFLTDDINPEELPRGVYENILNKKAKIDPSKKYTISLVNNLCPHHYSHMGYDEDCDLANEICRCQNLKGNNDFDTIVQDSDIKLGKLIKYYKDNGVECVTQDTNHHSCFLFQDEDGKFATIVPSEYNLKPRDYLEKHHYQKEFFLTNYEAKSFLEINFLDEGGICKNAKEKFDKKTKETYLDCTVEQKKLKNKLSKKY